jgi:YrbI family 3-deoxy-D-manno-octulosonate 8-phosphate phosphatase
MIKYVFFDFDGVFTDNHVYVTEKGVELIRSSRFEGYGIRLLEENNIGCIILSSEKNKVAIHRAKKLNIEIVLNCDDKVEQAKIILDEYNLRFDQVAFLGNDVNDIPLMQHAGYPACVGDAWDSVKKRVKYITKRSGGDGAVREFCEHIVKLNKLEGKDMKELKKFARPEFPVAEKVGDRDWGEEDLLVLASGKYIMKKMFVKSGHKGGLQFHRLKDEAGYLVSGEMIIRMDDGKGGLEEKVIGPGDVYRFPPGVVHQGEAITDCVVIEASTPHFDDRVSCEKMYGLLEDESLPTTTLEEIVEK